MNPRFKFRLNDGDLAEANKLSSNLIDFKSKVIDFEEYIASQEVQMEAMKSIIEKHKTELNFVVLDQGFSHLLKSKNNDAKWIKVNLLAFGFFLLFIPSIAAVAIYTQQAVNNSLLQIILHALPLISIELILLYFFRINHFQLNSTKTQILQLELRRSLCQFIEGYANYSSSIKKQDPTALEKFESLIFSGLTSNEEKLPTTFDGLDSLVKLVNTVKGTAKS